MKHKINNMKYEIIKSYSRTIQLQEFCPTHISCSLKCECEENEVKEKSKELYDFCKRTVNNDIRELQIEKVEQLKESKKIEL